VNLGFYSYLGATIAYAFFAILLLFSWRESLQGKLLFISVVVSACWSLMAVKISLHHESSLLLYQALEIIRYIAWYVFLFKLFDVSSPDVGKGDSKNSGQINNSYRRFVHKGLPITVGLALLVLINELLAQTLMIPGQFVLGIIGNVLLALAGMALIEQLYRNTSVRFRWATKYLFLGVGGIFAYEFYLYSDSSLFCSI